MIWEAVGVENGQLVEMVHCEVWRFGVEHEDEETSLTEMRAPILRNSYIRVLTQVWTKPPFLFL